MENLTAEIITIGDEILYGQILDTNSKWIAEALSHIGFKVVQILSVSDTENAIVEALENGIKRAKVLIFTGGLGPTKDDLTKHTLNRFFADELRINPTAEAHIKAMFERRGLPFTELNRQQAAIPSKSIYLHNAKGTAPGMWFEENEKVIISLPGVPLEMKYLMEAEVLPRLKANFETPEIKHFFIKTIGIGESFLAEKIADWEDALPEYLKLAYLPSIAEVKLRLSTSLDNGEAQKQIEKLLPLIKEYVYALSDIPLEQAIGINLLKENSTLSTAESCTGGNISHLITSIPGSSAYFLGAVVSYANSAKSDILMVKSETLSNFGAVSEQTVIEMAEGVQKLIGSSYAIATSGIAGPDGGTVEKPVGTIWMAVTDGKKTVTQKLNLGNDRKYNIEYTSKAALNLLRRQLNG